MWIDLEDNETKKTMHPIKDKHGKPTGSERIFLPAFDLYSNISDTETAINLLLHLPTKSEHLPIMQSLSKAFSAKSQ